MIIGGRHLLWFVLFQSLVVGALCCTCKRNHPQQIFCENEFVMKVYLDQYKRGDYGFSMKIEEVFKGDVTRLNVTNGLVELSMEYLCGIEMMKIGESYIIFGKSKNGQLFTDVCPSIRGNQPWSDTSVIYRSGLKGLYQLGCNCPVKRFREIIQSGCIPRFTYLNTACTLVRTEQFWACIKHKYPHYTVIDPNSHFDLN